VGSIAGSSARRADETGFVWVRSHFVLLLCLLAAASFAQDAAPKQAAPPQQRPARPAEEEQENNAVKPPSNDQPTGAPADAAKKDVAEEQPAAVVIEVAGIADWAPAKTSPLVAEGWTAIKLADRLVPGTLIRTGLRSHVNLQFGETTTVSVRGATYASVDQYYRSAGVETVNIGMGYGTVRGGSSEGTFRSQVTIDSPVATLAKRGTEGWQISVEAATGRYRISLAEEGLVEAIEKARGRGAAGQRVASRTVEPGEYATETNIRNMWIEQAVFDRNVWFYDPSAITPAEAAFAANNPRGFGTLSPGGGMELRDLTLRDDPSFFFAQSNLQPPISPIPRPPLGGDNNVPDGNFGTPGIFKRR
jgi:hypothetical protein